MSYDVAAIKANADIVSVVGHYVDLKKRGTEYLGLCPFHSDSNPSFYVVPAKGICHCFSCDEGGDVIEFLQKMEGIDFKAACERLGGKNDWQPKIREEKRKPQPERITSKPPADAPTPNMAVRGLGEPSRIWPYRDVDGSLFGYVARYDPPGGKKDIRCWTWGQRGDEKPKWGCGHWTKPRPLYGLNRLSSGKHVMVVEGEKAADAAQKLLGQYVVITWPGGANAWKYADWSPLKGRRVDLWPDNDEAGIAAMDGLRALLEDPAGLACHGKIIDPNRMADGFDAADWEEGTPELMQWLRARAKPYPAEAAPPPPEPPAEPPPPPPDDIPPEAYESDIDDDAPIPMSEDMLADRFAARHGEDWRFVRMWNSWFHWEGDGWRKDETGLVDRIAVELTRKAIYWSEAAELTPASKRMINSRRVAGAVRDMAQNDRRIAAKVDQWDTDPWLLGVPGGVVDLRKGEFLKATREQFITKRTACAPEKGEPRLWVEFLKRITAGDESLQEYLQRYAGYCLTGATSEHALAFLYGTGANGKTTFLHTLSQIVGDYAVSAGFEVLADSKFDRHPTEIARLRGARLVVTEETDAGGRWNEGRVKRLTGGGKISAHFMRQDDFEFEPQFKLLIAGNHKPVIKAVDEAIKRRIHLIPFTVTIPPEERDKALLEKLRTEWPRILNWAIEGCLLWQERSLSPGERILEATEQYIESEDVLGAWIDECCLREGETEGKALFDSYRKWCDAQGEHAWTRRAWSNALIERGFGRRKSNGAVYFFGISTKLGANL